MDFVAYTVDRLLIASSCLHQAVQTVDRNGKQKYCYAKKYRTIELSDYKIHYIVSQHCAAYSNPIATKKLIYETINFPARVHLIGTFSHLHFRPDYVHACRKED